MWGPLHHKQQQQQQHPVSSSPDNHSSPKSHSVYSNEKMRDQNDIREDRIKQEKYQDGYGNKMMVESQQDLLLKQTEEKRKLAIQQHHQLNHIQMQHELQQKALAEHIKYRSTPPLVSQQIKQEPNFNIYGYQPFQQMFISHDKLQMHLAGDRVGDRQCKDEIRSNASGSPGLASPPPLIKEKGSVIVENKIKDQRHANESPHPHHRDDNKVLNLMTAGQQISPRQQHAAHSQPPERLRSPAGIQHVGMYNTSTTDPNEPVNYKQEVKVTRTQSPLHVASPQQLSAAVMQPMELPRPNSKPGLPSTSMSNPAIPTIAQPPVSLSSTIPYSYSVIQQGLVPNPLYTNTSLASSSSSSIPTSSIVSESIRSKLSATCPQATHSQVTMATGTTTVPAKRKPTKDGTVRKKPKMEKEFPMGAVSSSLSEIPVTTPQIPTNSSPYTTATKTSASSSSSPFLDSFKAFVENTVQNAFKQDLEQQKQRQSKQHPKKSIKNRQQKDGQPMEPMQKDVQPMGPMQKDGQPMGPMQQPVAMTSGEVSMVTTANTDRVSSTSVATSSSLMETINRVANGLIDTDSDTLSAPSPPPQPGSNKTTENTISPNKSGNHPKLKKAWLLRHSDEDKDKERKEEEERKPEEDMQQMCCNNDSRLTSTAAAVKDCYVNCSYISPTKEGESKSPISLLAVPNGGLKELSRREDETTTSASETESQPGSETNPLKRRMKSKRQRQPGTTGKRTRSDSESTTSSGKSRSRKSSKCSIDKVKPCEIKKEDGESQDCDKTSEVLQDSDDDQKSESTIKDSAPTPEPEEIPEGPAPPKRRGRKPKVKKEEKSASSSNATQKPLNKLTITQLKKTQDAFLQDGACVEVTPKLMKCRECKPNLKNKKISNSFCRFYAFRKLRYSSKGYLSIAGFSETADADPDDIALWSASVKDMSTPMLINIAQYIITHVGDKFCELVEQEKHAFRWATENCPGEVAWKRAVQGVREMCDVCDTTLFNIHWVCHKCGFVVCLDCYRVKMKVADDKDEDNWLTCSANKQAHEPSKLMLTQIIPNNVLWELGTLIHDVRNKWNIKSNCPCGMNRINTKNGLNPQLVDVVNNHISNTDSKEKYVNGISDEHNSSKRHRSKKRADLGMSYNPDTESPLSLLADVASMDGIEKARDTKRTLNKVLDKYSGDSQTEEQEKGCSTLRELLTKSTKHKTISASDNNKKAKNKSPDLDDIIQSVVEKSLPKDIKHHEIKPSTTVKLCHYVPKNGQTMNGRTTPVKTYTLTETSVLYPDVPHSWLCDGRLLRLHDGRHKGNLQLFQQQWQQGQPVLVSGCQKYLNMNLWNPQAFSREFGSQENDLVNCHNGLVLIGHQMRVFWDGFEYMQKRLKDSNKEPLMLKLKDWPPTEDFRDLLPSRFDDIMRCLPLQEYTHRTGILNLASRLPDFFVKPDLGPKMYNAYGSAHFPREGTTNLHIDVSDAVNMMVYVGVPNDDLKGIDHEAAALKSIDEEGCDIITKRRVREVNERPGAVWHIFDAQDADKIRDLLNKVGKEQGDEVEPENDPIHDQSWYLDVLLRERLHREYGVLGYTIIQCLGDAVFIPAGSPHQVRNLHSCIKVAEDFVSPEHLRHCFKLTHEFRHLSDTHSNHEDKLQVKNIIYHAVKDAVAVLSQTESSSDDDSPRE